MAKSHLRSVESYFDPGVHPFNSLTIKAKEADAPINLSSTGVVMSDVQDYIFLGQKQAVEISIRLDFSTQIKDVLF